MFYKKFVYACMINNITIQKFCDENGFNRSTVSRWKPKKNSCQANRIPHQSTIEIISKYFSISSEYFNNNAIKVEELPKYLIEQKDFFESVETTKNVFDLIDRLSKLSPQQLNKVYRYVCLLDNSN